MPSDPKIRQLQMEDWDAEESTNITAIAPEVQRALDAPPKLRACLLVLTGTNAGELCRLDGPETILGRGTQASVRLSDDGISRRHARIVRSKGQLVVEDLGSANGTFVNDEPVMSQVLKEGDKIRLGSTIVLKFGMHDELEEKFQQTMYESALRDGLTRIYNKKYLMDRLRTEMAYAVRHRTLLSVLMFDVDHFKKINDERGHLGGDYVLEHLASLIGGALRTEDVFGRYGGEEFLIVCRGIPGAHASLLAERLRGIVANAHFDFEGSRVPVTVSIGVCTFPDVEMKTVDELIAGADEALYASKHAGRNRVTVKTP